MPERAHKQNGIGLSIGIWAAIIERIRRCNQTDSDGVLCAFLTGLWV